VEKKLLAVSVFACLLGGCATTNDSTARDQPRDEGVYVTGSRIPQKSSGTAPVGQVSQEEWQKQNKGMMGQPAGSGK
jgi:hypothetical protein